jgi:DNA-binding NarL/FixJ family response regulator
MKRHSGSEQDALPIQRCSLAFVRILPCIASKAARERLMEASKRTGGVWLTAAIPAVLVDRAVQDSPNLIVIGDEAFRMSRWSAAHVNLFRSTPTLLLANNLVASDKARAARVGIHSVLPLEVDDLQIAAALAALDAGLTVTIPSSASDREFATRNSARDLATRQAEHVTEREFQVLKLMAIGRHNREIAAMLQISEHTVKFHVSSILGKLGAGSRTEAVRIGITRGLVAI